MGQNIFRRFADRLRENGFSAVPHSSYHFSPVTCTSEKGPLGQTTHIPSIVSFVKPNSMNPVFEVDIWKNAGGGFSVRVDCVSRGIKRYFFVVFDENGNAEMGDANAMEKILFPQK